MFLKPLSKTVVFIVIACGFVSLGQATQYWHSTHELRYQTLQYWQLLHPDQNTITYQFIDRCMNNPPRHRGTDEEIELYECGRNLGAHALVEELEKTDQMLTRLAWPLSLLEQSRQTE